MYLVWDGDQPLADREMVAHLYEVSQRTVRRHCAVVRHERRTGRADGRHGGGGTALYNAFDAAAVLAEIAPRPGRSIAVLHHLLTRR